MATRIVCAVQNIEGEGSAYFDVNENYDSVMEKLFPTRPSSSALESRENQSFTLENGNRRIILERHTIFMVEEEPDGE